MESAPSLTVPPPRAQRLRAALRARHAAEVARLRAALRAMEEAHAAEVARLRAEHAADTAGLRRAVEVQRWAPDTARTGALRASGGPGEGAAPRPQAAPSPARPRATRGRLARLTGKGGCAEAAAKGSATEAAASSAKGRRRTMVGSSTSVG
jgi:hypothetical protein